MLVWNGDGGIYDPATDSWLPMSRSDAPSSRTRHTGVWTGSQMVVFGGVASGEILGDGAMYDPRHDCWMPLPMDNAPRARFAHTAVWTGSAMVVFGGIGPGQEELGDGASYYPPPH
jgi:N-acetylneuraminic acid mutarotase